MSNITKELISLIPKDWQKVLKNEFPKEYFAIIANKIMEDFKTKEIFPSKNKIFEALKITPLKNVNVVILGQDPYHNYNQAHGLSFSIPKSQKKIPPSLKNIYKELKSDLDIPIVNHGNLSKWAKQGVLLLNSTLTVEAHIANSHEKYGWGFLTDEIIKKISDEKSNVVFLLWGNFAQKKIKLINKEKHFVISSVHPSPLSASRGFFNSKPFSQINSYLEKNDKVLIDWDLNENPLIQPTLF